MAELCYILTLSYPNHKTLKNSIVLKMPVVTCGFSLDSLFSYTNVTTSFALKTVSAVDSIANRGVFCEFGLF